MPRIGWAVLGTALLLAAGACHSEPDHPSTAPLTAAPAGSPSPSTASTAPTSTQPTVSAAGARLTPPKDPTNKPPDNDPTCASLVDTDQRFRGSCRLVTTPHATAALVDELTEGSPTSEHRILVWRKTSEGFSLALRFSEQDSGTTGPSAQAAVSDVAQDNDPKIVVSYHDPASLGTGQVPTLTGIDVAEATGTVVVHRTLLQGQAARATGGGLETWNRIDGSSPLQYDHQVIRYRNGDWRIEKDEKIPAESVPKPDPRGNNFYS